MTRNLLLVSLFLCWATSLAYALPPELSSIRSLPPKGSGDVPIPASVQGGGDNFGNATVIPGLPYSDAGSTCGFIDDYWPNCEPPDAPDVMYRFTPTADVCVDVSLCNSSYDTGLAIYNGTTNLEIACNDDFCGLQSQINGVNLLAGNTYYFIIDAWGGACGNYAFSVVACPPPPVCVPCPANAVLEGEPVCYSGYVDTYNAGCNSIPPTVLTLPCNPDLTICGTYGTWDANQWRDTDWYEFTLTGPTVLTVSVNGGGLTGSALAILDAACPPNVVWSSFNPYPQCTTVSSPPTALGAGTYRIVTASFFDSTPCATPYVLHIQGMACPTGVPASSWGKLKQIYR